jgi:hypothetical protein
MPSPRSIALLYLNHYAAKNLTGASELFAENIVLRDWKIRVEGKTAALNETCKNFEAVSTLYIDVLAVYEHKNTVAAELKIVIDGKEELYVVDIIEVNAAGLITAIRAFVGRGDS